MTQVALFYLDVDVSDFFFSFCTCSVYTDISVYVGVLSTSSSYSKYFSINHLHITSYSSNFNVCFAHFAFVLCLVSCFVSLVLSPLRTSVMPRL